MALHRAQPGEVVDLQPLGPALAGAKTTALVKSDRFEAVRLIVRAGTTIPSHSVPGHITLLCLEGDVLLHVDSEIALKPGQWLYLERGALHAVEAREDSAILLTIMFDD